MGFLSVEYDNITRPQGNHSTNSWKIEICDNLICKMILMFVPMDYRNRLHKIIINVYAVMNLKPKHNAPKNLERQKKRVVVTGRYGVISNYLPPKVEML